MWPKFLAKAVSTRKIQSSNIWISNSSGFWQRIDTLPLSPLTSLMLAGCSSPHVSSLRILSSGRYKAECSNLQDVMAGFQQVDPTPTSLFTHSAPCGWGEKQKECETWRNDNFIIEAKVVLTSKTKGQIHSLLPITRQMFSHCKVSSSTV